MRLPIATCLLLVLPAPQVAAEVVPVRTEAPAGDYRLDPDQATIMAGLSHLGLTTAWVAFTRADAALRFDPTDPESMEITVKIDPASVTPVAGNSADGREQRLRGTDFLDAAGYPEIAFRSQTVRLVAPDRAAVTGDLTLHGIRRRITLSVTFNGGYPARPDDPGGARLGFSATGTIFRSDFGIATALPLTDEPGLGDEVAIRIEAEFINPGASGPQLGP
ncbi:MAG: YceI family protein [Paracoccaceae bacterium]